MSVQKEKACIEIKGQTLVLHEERVAFWREENCLLITDLHLGKAQHFQKHGYPVSGRMLFKDLDRLASVIKELQPERVLILGDLFHSDYNEAWEKLVEFTRRYPQQYFELVPGNHDVLSLQQYERARIHLAPLAHQVGPFVFSHDVIDDLPSDLYCVSGHIHPGIHMVASGLPKITLPCFYFGSENALLPAFGSFTGLHRIIPSPGDHVYAIVEREVVEVSERGKVIST